jgi:hypothetical protein
VAEHQPEHIRPLRAQGDANSDLVLALCDQVGNDAIDAHRRQQQRCRAECAK